MVIEPLRRVAIIVDPGLPFGALANTVAAIAIGLGAAAPDLGGDELTDARGRGFRVSSNCPVPVLQAPATVIGALYAKSLPAPPGAVAVVFPGFARSLHTYADYAALVPTRDLLAEAIDGIGLAGPERWVRSLTGALKLLR